MRVFRKIQLLTLSFTLMAVSGCSSIGPRTVANDSFSYTEVLSDSWKQRMLFNIVRMRYGDTPFFLDVASVINQYSLETGANVNGQVANKVNGASAGDTFLSLGGHGTYTDRPTITYTPLAGEKFARSLMKPLPPSAVLSMIEAGYPVNYVMRMCVQSINGIRNRHITQLQPKPADAEFYPLLELMQRIQDSGAIDLRVQHSNECDVTVIRIRRKVDASVDEDSHQTRKILGLNPNQDEFKVVYGSKNKDDKELAILTRSILQIIMNVSSLIEVPDAHVNEKIVNPTIPDITLGGTQEPPLISIRSSPSKPDNAFVAVPYQSFWFYIDNRDMKSKAIFTFMMFLFSLTETGSKEGVPIVTISAGG